MGQPQLDRTRYVLYCSSSISNWRQKLKNRFQLDDWSYFGSMFRPAVFFGMYNYKDWLRFLWHRGQKYVFWCGSDILYLQQHPVWQWLIMHSQTKHICENLVEWQALFNMGIYSKVQPCLFDNVDNYQISYQWSEDPKLYLAYHKGREHEYHADNFKNDSRFVLLEGLPEQEFNEIIKHCQGAIRLNAFDGFAETLGKSVLMGQYPISNIAYPYIKDLSDFITLNEIFDWLKTKKQPNYEAERYWRKELSKTLEEIIGG